MNIFHLFLLFFSPPHSLVFFTMGVNYELGHSHASGGFPHVCHVSLGCVPIQNCTEHLGLVLKKRAFSMQNNINISLKALLVAPEACAAPDTPNFPKSCEPIYGLNNTAIPTACKYHNLKKILDCNRAQDDIFQLLVFFEQTAQKLI